MTKWEAVKKKNREQKHKKQISGEHTKCENMKFHFVVVKNNVKEMYQKSVLYVHVFLFWLDLLNLLLFSLPSPFSIIRFCFLQLKFENNNNLFIRRKIAFKYMI